METRIQKTLEMWFPDAFADGQKRGTDSGYEILQQFAPDILNLIQNDKDNEKEAFRIVNMFFQKGSFHDKNIIENNF